MPLTKMEARYENPRKPLHPIRPIVTNMSITIPNIGFAMLPILGGIITRLTIPGGNNQSMAGNVHHHNFPKH
jgi:hypothetical protein